jgi:hypothetical protein
MNVGFIRPKISELVFQLFGRPLHPELFEVFAARNICRDEYQATIQITDSSHTITWQSREICLTEVTSSVEHPLPQRRLLLLHPLRGERSDRVQCASGIVYQASFQVERLSAAVFWHVHEELAQEGARRGLLFQFRTSNRITLGPLSYINFEPCARSLSVQSFHTFPEDCAVVKTQSLFELERGR